MNTQQIIRNLPKGIINWYEFHKGAKALIITEQLQQEMDFEVLAEALRETGLAVSCMSISEVLSLDIDVACERAEHYDYILMIGVLEYCKEPVGTLRILRSLLTDSGKLLLGTDNRLGLRYFCGDQDAFTDRNFDGIEDYFRINEADRKNLNGRSYSKAEIEGVLDRSGFSDRRFYTVLPELTAPQLIFAEDYLPEEELDVRYFPSYRSPNTVFLEEERLYTTLIQNGLFHIMANSYFIECSLDNQFANVKQVTISMERGKENALATIIRRDGKVAKKAVYEEGQKRLYQLIENDEDLRAHDVPVVDSTLEKSDGDISYVMPYVKGEIVTNYFRRLLKEDREEFYKELDSFWELILRSSEHVPYEEVNWEQFEPGWEKRKADDPNKDKWKKIAFSEDKDALGVILKRGYIDLVFLNCFHTEDGFLFYDQEFYLENLPAKVILLRSIDFIYWGNLEMESILPRSELQERYGLNEHLQLWQKMSWTFIEKLRNEKELRSFHQLHRRDMGIINSNRQRMNYSENEYQRLFRDIFHNTEGKKIYLFGSGNFTRKFLSQFGKDYEIAGILDNNQSKWGTTMEEIPITGADVLLSMEPQEYKVIVCIKNYISVVKQLLEMGVKNYGIYDWNLEYPRKMPVAISTNVDKQAAPKKYHVGYIAGVFDLFHIGHLNMFKRAKEQCDYLIVGVVTDESVRKNKKTTPYIPFEERIELVRSCRYVDEAVEIPPEYGDTDEAYRRYRFDVQFSGSDYENDPEWLAKKAYLQKQGSDLVFFPYTQSTSSTKIKGKIGEKQKNCNNDNK